MTPAYDADGCTVYHGDCLEVMRTLPENSVDAVVTDPPAGISFMGRDWDHHKGGRDQWIAWMTTIAAEALRLVKPGGHALVWSLPRTSHWTATAWENASWECRDQILHLGGQGFPKSLNVSNAIKEHGFGCECVMESLPYISGIQSQNLSGVRQGVASHQPLSGVTEQDVQSSMWSGPDSETQATHQESATRLPVVQKDIRSQRENKPVQSQDVRIRVPGRPQELPSGMDSPSSEYFLKGSQGLDGGEHEKLPLPHDRYQQSSMEGGCNDLQKEGELQRHSLPSLSNGVDKHGEEGWVCNGAPSGNGQANRTSLVESGVRASQGPQPDQQRLVESGTLAEQSKPQNGRAWSTCDRCGKPIIPDGWGTALKPAAENWWLLRKPLSEATIAANVLKWNGCGALNIAAARVGTDDTRSKASKTALGLINDDSWKAREVMAGSASGRWPANIVLSDDPEVAEAFSAFGEKGGGFGVCGSDSGGSMAAQGVNKMHRRGRKDLGETVGYGDTGSAARFFYCAKASKRDRCQSKHPCIKPLNLVSWLSRLICPPGGLILDPFAGSGTLGEAALREGFRSILIEQESEYISDILFRMRTATQRDTDALQPSLPFEEVA